MAAAAPEFWQQFPKLLAADSQCVRIGLFPSECAELHELQGGEQKTHAVWFQFATDRATSVESLSWVHRPTRLAAAPEWVAASNAISCFIPAARDGDMRLQSLLSGAIVGENSFFARRETIDEYGWRNYGDTYADHEAAYYQGSAPPISHYNNQFDVIYGFLAQWWRTGDAAWFELADTLARHVADIDVYHTDEDRSAYNGGLFWFTDHYLDAATSTHRTYSRFNQPANGSPYGGGPGPEHNFTTGLLHYYYVTGSTEARDAVLELADWVVDMEDGRKNLFGLIDAGPTGLATHGAGGSGDGLGRAAGNSINALLDGWLLTASRSYLELAESLIRRVVHPDDDLAARDLLNAEKRWSYTVLLSSLARYLAIKEEAGHADQEYAYARACLLHYAEWMLEHERPYLDRRETLEFPTEAWAAQEFRKANVLRLAAVYAEGEKRQQMFARGDKLADRAWRDLMEFDSRSTTRALAILMSEGMRDMYFRAGKAPVPACGAECCDFGPRGAFVPQRLRVRRRLKSAGGWLEIAARMLNPHNWRATTLRR